MATIDFKSIERNYAFDAEDALEYEQAAWVDACAEFETIHPNLIPDDGSVLFWWDGTDVYLADSNGIHLDEYENESEDLANIFEDKYAACLAEGWKVYCSDKRIGMLQFGEGIGPDSQTDKVMGVDVDYRGAIDLRDHGWFWNTEEEEWIQDEGATVPDWLQILSK